jgi:hypothetical protein
MFRLSSRFFAEPRKSSNMTRPWHELVTSKVVPATRPPWSLGHTGFGLGTFASPLQRLPRIDTEECIVTVRPTAIHNLDEWKTIVAQDGDRARRSVLALIDQASELDSLPEIEPAREPGKGNQIEKGPDDAVY